MTDRSATGPHPGEGSLSLGEFASACGNFAFSLFGRLRHEPGNLVCSPFCASAALLLAHAGAGGSTRDELAAGLGVGPGERDFRLLHRSLSRKLQRSTCEWHSAARLWPQTGYPLLAEFVEAVREFCGEEPQPLDFAGDPAAAAERINAWVEGATRGRIPQIVDASAIRRWDRMALTSAAYFRGAWLEPFDPEKTHEEDFRPGEGGTVRVAMMHQTQWLSGAATDGLKVVGLPYDGSPLEMILILPDAVDGLPALERRCDWGGFGRWTAEMRKRPVTLSVPRFTFRSTLSLAPGLSAMGMLSAFLPDRADFSRLTRSEKLSLDEVRHLASIEVAEEGTVAAAATLATMRFGMPRKPPPPPPPLEFRADHPFLFALVDRDANLALFLGRVENPAA